MDGLLGVAGMIINVGYRLVWGPPQTKLGYRIQEKTKVPGTEYGEIKKKIDLN